MEEPNTILISMYALAVVIKRHWKPNTQTSASFQRLVKLRPANTVEKAKPVTNRTIRFILVFSGFSIGLLR